MKRFTSKNRQGIHGFSWCAIWIACATAQPLPLPPVFKNIFTRVIADLRDALEDWGKGWAIFRFLFKDKTKTFTAFGAKKLSLLLLCFHIFCGVGFATDSIVVGFGTASGESQFDSSSSYNHKTTGTSYNVGYQKILENGFLMGVGYQNFELSGDKSVGTITVKTEKFQVSGLYGAIGYSAEIFENLSLQPNFRLGIANSYKADYSSSANSNNFSDSGSGLMIGFVLPVVYQLDSWNVGGQILVPIGGFLAKRGDFEDTFLLLPPSYQLVAGYNF